MIHNNSNDPVLIKKIRLRIWFLRDEVKAVVQARLDHTKGEIPDLTDLIEEYKVKELASDDPGLQEATDPGELEMAKALEEDPGAAEMAAAMMEGQGEDSGSESEDQSEKDEEEGKVTIIQRTPQIPDDRIVHGTTVLTEVGMDHMFFFCNENFLEGQSIVIEFLVPKKFILNADIKYCRPYNMKSRIISERRTPFRAAAKFTFLRAGERTLLRNFLQSVEPEIPEEAPKVKKPSGGGGGDDFDELDDLDL